MPFLYIREPIFLVSHGMWSKGGENICPSVQFIKISFKRDVRSYFWHLCSFYANTKLFALMVQVQMTIFPVFLHLYLMTFSFDFNL